MAETTTHAPREDDRSAGSFEGNATAGVVTDNASTTSGKFQGQHEKWRKAHFRLGRFLHLSSGDVRRGALSERTTEHRRRQQRWAVGVALSVLLTAVTAVWLWHKFNERALNPNQPESRQDIRELPDEQPAPESPAKDTSTAPAEPKPVAPVQPPIASVQVHSGPLPGQESRASSNIGVTPPAGTKEYVLTVVGTPNLDSPRFAILKDVSWGSDKAVHTDLKNGSVIPAQALNDVYFGRVEGATQPFTIEFRAR